MNIRRFIAKDAGEAIKMVKKEMGQDAVILRTRTIPLSKGRGRKPGRRIEVTAAVDYEAPAAVTQDSGGWSRLEKEIKEIKDALLYSDAGGPSNYEMFFSKELQENYRNFKNFGLNPEVIRELMKEGRANAENVKADRAHLVRESLHRVLNRIRIDGMEWDKDKGRKIYSFIGPTGVGKTTTLAKLAVLSAVRGGRKTALITLDTFRIAAATQLQTYARIMGVPVEIAVNRNDLQKSIQKHSNCDRIFIDTAGKSPNSGGDIMDLVNFFRIPEEIHPFLVLSATTQYQNLIKTEERFGALPFKSYIFTKLDETQNLSTMINFLISRWKPVSYFSTGQQVPEDIEIASRKKLATFLLAGMRGTLNNSIREEKSDGSGCRH